MNERIKGKTPLEQRQERIQKLKEIYQNNKGKSREELERLFVDYLSSFGLSYKTIREYLEQMNQTMGD